MSLAPYSQVGQYFVFLIGDYMATISFTVIIKSNISFYLITNIAENKVYNALFNCFCFFASIVISPPSAQDTDITGKSNYTLDIFHPQKPFAKAVYMTHPCFPLFCFSGPLSLSHTYIFHLNPLYLNPKAKPYNINIILSK